MAVYNRNDTKCEVKCSIYLRINREEMHKLLILYDRYNTFTRNHNVLKLDS